MCTGDLYTSQPNLINYALNILPQLSRRLPFREVYRIRRVAFNVMQPVSCMESPPADGVLLEELDELCLACTGVISTTCRSKINTVTVIQATYRTTRLRRVTARIVHLID
ncbi:hypothetical protein GCK72_003296 [Caenorhabditis remanei]|uniref:Uncharacterized protein n=1 Tax=Caenorhabditis remanei TaxID=31234 RepID=A0A6A5HTD0_CAERE|nr:hypothetical protein GCK72_003296 [Caenorhabditis remanei]KAF1771470.1 hypothetical protein GCK72_003296 [Caenorhabditis remanei]